MSDFANKREQALAACNKVLNGIEDSTIAISATLLLCKKIARLINDVEGLEWLGYEQSGYPRGNDGYILHDAWAIGAAHGREYLQTSKDGKRQKAIFTELCGELETLIFNQSSAIHNYSMQGFSTSGDYGVIATNNMLKAVSSGTNSLIESIKTAERRLEILRSQYYNYALKWQIELSFGNLSTTIYEEYRNRVDAYFAQLPIETIQKLNAIEDLMEDGNTERYAQVLTSCRRLWSDVAKLLFNELLPNYQHNKYMTLSGKEIDVTGDHVNNKLSAVIEILQNKSPKNTLVGSTVTYLVDWMEQINNRQSAGVHSEITREEAAQCIIHTYIALGDILRLKNIVSDSEGTR